MDLNPNQFFALILFFVFLVISPIVGIIIVIRDVINSRKKGKQIDEKEKSEQMSVPPFE